MNRSEIRSALDAMGIRHASNTVRPYRSARCAASATARLRTGPLTGVVTRASVWSGAASDGWKSEYQPRPVWWVLVTIEDDDGHIVWGIGSRYASERKAREHYDAQVDALREDVGADITFTGAVTE